MTRTSRSFSSRMQSAHLPAESGRIAWRIAAAAVAMLAAGTAAKAGGQAAGSAGASDTVYIPVIQCHRGAGNMAPENTLESYRLAWSLGTIPEADVRSTRDGVLVAFHDSDFSRLVKDCPADIRKLGVRDMDWAGIRQFDVGSCKGRRFAGQRIPRIDDVFKEMRGHAERRLYLDVKDIALETLARMARSRGVTAQLILASSNYGHIREWKRLLPDSSTLLWMGDTEEKLRARIQALREADFEAVTQLQVHVHPKGSDLSADEPFALSTRFLRELAAELKPRGIVYQALPWQICDEKAYTRLMDLGVESFATDCPEVTVDAMHSYHRRATTP